MILNVSLVSYQTVLGVVDRINLAQAKSQCRTHPLSARSV